MIPAVRSGTRSPSRLLFLAAALASAGVVSAEDGPAAPALARGTPAPAFEAVRMNGGTISLASLRGRVVLLNFWGIACPPCRIEMPELEKIRRRYVDQGLEILGIEEMNASAGEASRFVDAIGVRYPILLDPQERIGRLYRLEAHPTTVIVDRAGRIAWINAGYLRGDEREIDQAVRDALAMRNLP
ncbi:MAG TPA: TlpA disulfide reductase family protein [Candidatus Polarisedimenticolia bacterium]|nr:TlpA disulfide reductase family protein [Candidatus Polarisedimenticolia bacterium]